MPEREGDCRERELCAPVEEEAKEDAEDAQPSEEFGSVKPKSLSTPYTPSRQERMEHELTHVPYRSWCPHCVRGKAIAMGHYARKSAEDDERKIPLVALDYAFLKKSSGSEEEATTVGEVVTMVIKDEQSGCVFPIPVPQQGLDPEEHSINCFRCLTI